MKKRVALGWQPAAARFSHDRTACKNCGADPQADPTVRGRPPGRPSRLDEIDPVAKSGSRGTRADQGVRPTIFAEFSQLEKRAALRLAACGRLAIVINFPL